jgi:hypothetical protein
MTTMTEHVHDQLAYYRDLTPEERRAVDAHLVICADCRATRAVYQRQDTALSAIPVLKPSRPLHPHRQAFPRRAVARLGDVLALSGLAAVLWLFALQVQAISQAGPTSSGTLEPAMLEPGIAIPPTSLQLPSPWLAALPWVATALLSVGGLFIFTRRSLIPTVIGGIVAALLLISFIPPLSALPNPVGLYWRAVGGYDYDPRLPFKNSFLIAGSPEHQIRHYLDQLIGQTGLAPLDPNQPLQRYEILRVGLHPNEPRTALVTTRFIYADGSSRVYPVPLVDPAVDIFGFWLGGWRADGLQRLRSEHLALRGQPFAGPEASIRLGSVRRLDLHPSANRLDEANPSHWLWHSVRVNRLVVAPDGSAFLIVIEQEAGQRQLWEVPLNGEPPIPVGPVSDVRAYGWSPDGRTIVYTRFDSDASAVDPTHPYAVMAVPRAAPSASATRAGPLVLVTGLNTDQLPGLSAEAAWFFANNALWRAPYDGGQPIMILEAMSSYAPRPSPDGTRVAYACGNAVCLVDGDGKNQAKAAGLQASEMAWSPDGRQLAVIDRDPNNLSAVRLIILSREGEVRWEADIAPRDATDPPQWTPDGNAVFIQTFPQDGRRIIAANLVTQEVLDLSREHWEAYFALAPDGKSLLLNNGRGDFWEVQILR